MNGFRWIVLLFAFVTAMPAMAFSTDDERVDSYLSVLATATDETKEVMLNRLQWSGLSDPRFYDEVENRLLTSYLSQDGREFNLLAYHARALGYSGNPKYRDTLVKVHKEAVNGKLRRHAEKALRDLDKFAVWNEKIRKSGLVVEGKSVEVATYLRMLSVDDVFVQRLAARAIFHEKRRDDDLLASVAKSLKALYLKPGLDAAAQDTAAWFCKALGQSRSPDYLTLLGKVADETPYKKIKKYAQKY
ncbi:hypothetical protein [Marinobacterium arenosum]|uniref:hypothetical protein n=1 Tax=Marinobacterium arenosum TaxID=2862496 RepID=UPI001C96CCAA|nr:hypothetical protein [Marinobacterium arenosum]MBY4676124.1 hypothetical protein [Marinobacterium arenosum]